jgi:Tfp pilus assembly protein PilN
MGINLLPWREAEYKKRKKNIGIEVSICLVILFCYLFFKHMHNAVIFEGEEIKARHLELWLKKTEKNYMHATLQKKEEIEEASQRALLENKMASSRFVLQAIYTFSNAMPDEMYFTEISKKAGVLHFFGKAASHEMLVQFLEAVKKQYAQRITVAEIVQEVGQENGIHFEIEVAA